MAARHAVRAQSWFFPMELGPPDYAITDCERARAIGSGGAGADGRMGARNLEWRLRRIGLRPGRTPNCRLSDSRCLIHPYNSA